MKKKVMALIIITLIMLTQNVKAKNTVSSYVKYDEDTYKYITNGYKNNKKNGNIVAGTYITKKDNNEYNNIFVVKYNEESKIVWDYVNEKEDVNCEVYSINYLYSNNKINGYIITIKENDIVYYLKLSLDGKLIEKQGEQTFSKINKIEEVYLEEIHQGYITVGEKIIEDKVIGYIVKYNSNLEKEWEKEYDLAEYSKISITDIVYILNPEQTLSYNILLNLENEEQSIYKLVNIDIEGNEIRTIKEDFEEKDTPHLIKTSKDFLLYGLTYEVKINKNKSQSYYLIKYNNQNEEEWETIGNTTVDPRKLVKLQVNKIENNEEYLIMTTNDTDKSIEVTKIKQNGAINNKIKKINNNYYDINDYLFENNTIYFIGQINCPEDDNCAYNKKVLYLVSDEDKVIEVEDNDSKVILIIITLLLAGGAITIAVFKRRKLKEN